MLDDGWIRVQVYIPETLRYKLRMACKNYQSDSLMLRTLIINVLKNTSEEDLEYLLEL